MAYCYTDKDLKNLPTMKRFRIKTKDGKIKVATLSRKVKLPTAKEIEAAIKVIDDRIALNETQFSKKEITGNTYDNTRTTSARDRETLVHDLDVMKQVVFVGESIEFLGYIPFPT